MIIGNEFKKSCASNILDQHNATYATYATYAIHATYATYAIHAIHGH
jgi:hypothetical protein